MGYPNLTPIHEDVEKGLVSQETRLNSAAMAQGFWDYDGKRFMTVFMRDAETPFDYIMRPYRMSGLCRQVIEILAEHLYCPGPSRRWSETAGNDFLQVVYEDNHFDSMMHRADELSALNTVAAVQVDADEGVFEDKPITLRLWGAQDFAVWTDPDNRTIPKVVCTVDRWAHGNTYRLWTENGVSRYMTPGAGQTMTGGRVATFQDYTPHEYGCLPFAFVHYSQPITDFWESGIGDFLTQGEIRVNDRLSRLDESINKHLNPIPVAENVEDLWNPIVEPMRFIRLKGSMMRPGPTGGYEDGPQPRLYFLQANVDIAGAWDDLVKFLSQMVGALNLPSGTMRFEQVGIGNASAIALIVEQAPLLTRARARRRPFGIYENDIARTILRCAGGHYGKKQFITDAKKGQLALAWPMPTIPVPTKDTLDLLLEEVTAGIKSLPMAVSQWYGVDREGAFQILEQVELDNEELKERAPTLALHGAGLPAGGEETPEDDDDDQAADDDDELEGDEDDDELEGDELEDDDDDENIGQTNGKQTAGAT